MTSPHDPVMDDTAHGPSLLPIPMAAALAERYHVVRMLGAGGMASVYLARDLRHDRLVAVKVLHAHIDASAERARFQREISILSRLVHPHIVPLVDSGIAESQPWFVMPGTESERSRNGVGTESGRSRNGVGTESSLDRRTSCRVSQVLRSGRARITR